MWFVHLCYNNHRSMGGGGGEKGSREQNRGVWEEKGHRYGDRGSRRIWELGQRAHTETAVGVMGGSEGL